MTTLTIEFPDSVAEELQRRTVAAGFERPGEYIAALLRERPADETALANWQTLGTIVNTQAEVEARLLEALDSGFSTPMTREDWDAIRREGKARVAELRRGGA